MGSTALTRAREQISSLSRRASELRGSSHLKAATDGAIVVAAGAGAGALDAALPEVQGVKPSLAGGLIAAGAGFAMRSPKLILVAAGALNPHAYNAAFDAVEGMGDKLKDD